MRKNGKIVAVIAVAASLIIAGVPLTYLIITNLSTRTQTPRVNIYVNSTIYSNIYSEV